MRTNKLFSSKRLLKPEMEILRSLKHKLDYFFESKQKPLALLPRFFNITSPLHDERYFDQLLRLAKSRNRLIPFVPSLKILSDTIARTGRSPYGMNRTRKGEFVTSKHIFIGGVEGLNTRTVFQWLVEEKQLKDDHIREGRTVWDAINDQAETFIRSKANLMAAAIEDIMEKFEEL